MGTQLPPQKGGRALQFLANLYCGWKHQDATWYEGSPHPGDFVLEGDPAPLPKKGEEPPQFLTMSIVAKWLHG